MAETSTHGSRKRAAAAAPKTEYAALTWTDVPHLQAQVEDLLVRETRARGWCSDADRVGRKLFPVPVHGTVFVDSDGRDCQGNEARDSLGFGIMSGRDPQGYDRDGFNVNGRDRGGFDADGKDAEGIHRDDPARFRYDAQGYTADGYDRHGYGRDGFNADGYNRSGYDREGRDRDKRNADGYTVEGVNREGKRYDASGNWYLVDIERHRQWRIERGSRDADRWQTMTAYEFLVACGGYVEGLGVDDAELPAWWDDTCIEGVIAYDAERHDGAFANTYNPRRRTAEQNIATFTSNHGDDFDEDDEDEDA